MVAFSSYLKFKGKKVWKCKVHVKNGRSISFHVMKLLFSNSVSSVLLHLFYLSSVIPEHLVGARVPRDHVTKMMRHMHRLKRARVGRGIGVGKVREIYYRGEKEREGGG